MDRLTQDDARAQLAEYAAVVRGRDPLILAALEAGLSISEVCAITRIARTTVYRLIAPDSGPASLPGHTGGCEPYCFTPAPLFLAPPTPAELAQAAGLTDARA